MKDVERVRLFEKDHAPDGFPAVEMSMMTRMADKIEALEKERDALKVQLDNAINAYDGCAVERDDLKAKLERAKKLMRFQWILEEDFEETWKEAVEEGRT